MEAILAWFVKIILQVLIDKFYQVALELTQKASIKRGIQLEAKKNLEHIKKGDEALDAGNINDWLKELNNEQ